MNNFEDFLLVIKSNCPEFSEDNFWIHFNTRHLSISQGWKIHVPFCEKDCPSVYQNIIKELIQQQVTFKVPLNALKLAALNSGQYGDEQMGKCLTIYPTSTKLFLRLLQSFSKIHVSPDTPKVLGEPRLTLHTPISFRYGDFVGRMYLDEIGAPIRYILNDQGEKIEDCLANTFTKIDELGLSYITETNEPTDLLAKIDEKYLILKKNAKSSHITLLGLRKEHPIKVTVKIARKGQQSSDTLNALRNEIKIHEYLNEHKYPFSPSLVEVIETDSGVALILEYIEGITLSEIQGNPPENLNFEINESISRLHALGIVHGDIKNENLLWNGKNIHLIDFGTSGRVGENRVITLKTPGYYDLSLTFEKYDFAMDEYSTQAVFFSMETGCPIVNIKNDRQTLVKLYKCAPLLYRQNLRFDTCKESRQADTQPSFNPTKIFNAALDYFEPSTGKWFNGHEFASYKLANINLGSSGIILATVRMKDYLKDDFDIPSIISKTLDTQIKDDPHSNALGFFNGNAGVAITFLICGKLLNNERYIEHAGVLLKDCLRRSTQFDYFAGRSGILTAACLALESASIDLEDDVYESLEKLLKLVSADSGIIGAKNLSTDKIETGLAHGSAGLAYALFHIGEHLKEDSLKDLSANIFESIFQNAQFGKSIFFDSDRSTQAPNSIWCKGAGGILWALLNSFGNIPRFESHISSYSEMFKTGLTITNPTLCHGMGGQLELARLLRSKAKRADFAEMEMKIASCLKAMLIEKSNKQYFLSENMAYVTPDLWLGFLGTASALIDDQISKNSIMTPSFLHSLMQKEP